MPQPTLPSEAPQRPQRDPAAVSVEEAVIPHVDVVDHAGDLGLAPPLLDMQRADDVGPTLTAKRVGRRRDRCPGPTVSGKSVPPTKVPLVPWLSAARSWP